MNTRAESKSPDVIRVLCVGEPLDGGVFELLSTAGFETSRVARHASSPELSKAFAIADVVLVDSRDPALPQLCALTRSHVVAIAPDSKSASRLEAHRAGAYDIVSADEIDELFLVLERAGRDRRMERELGLLRARSAEGAMALLVGRSVALSHVRELVGAAAALRRPVLVSGEAGTGKRLIAQLVHQLSPLANRPLVGLDCSLVDDDVIARAIRSEHAGTIVLENADRLSAAGADTIVRSLRGDGEYSRSHLRLVLTIRTVAGEATPGCSPVAGVSVLTIPVAPLRERRGDIPLLVRHFAEEAGETSESALLGMQRQLQSLLTYDWPGNVRELRHWVERHHAGEAVPPAAGVHAGRSAIDVPDDASWTLEQLERRYIEFVLAHEEEHHTRAAERLGIDRRTLYRKLREFRARDTMNQ